MGPRNKKYFLSVGLLLLGVGCVNLGSSSSTTRSAPPAGSSPAADFLIARQLELDGDRENAFAAYQRAVEADPNSPYLLRRIAEMAWRLGRFEEARSYAERAHAMDPADPENRLFLGKIYQIEKRNEEAVAILLGEDGEPVSPDAAALLFAIAMDEKNAAIALSSARWLMEVEPERLRSYFFLAAAYNAVGQFEESEAVYREALKISPGNLAVYAELSRTQRELGNFPAEIEIYRQVLVIYPHHHPTLRTLLEAQIRNHQTVGAIVTMKEILTFYPDDLRTMLKLAVLEYEMERYEDSAAHFQELLNADPNRYEIRFFLALVQQQLDQEEEAMENFSQIPAGHSRYVEARTQMAAYWEERQEWGKALEELQAIRDVGTSPSLDLYIANMMAKDGRIQEAIEFSEAIRNDSPEDEDLLFNLGVLQGEAGELDKSMDVMHEVLILNPDHPGALNYIGYTWAEKGIRLQEAQDMIQRALDQRPNDGYITDSLGWVFYMRGIALRDSGGYDESRNMLKQSVEELEKAVQLTGSDPVVTEHLGDAYLALDEKPRALESYRRALEEKESDTEALKGKFEKLRMELGAQ
jgi:tetratricopeptide (TPR) repeat protein